MPVFVERDLVMTSPDGIAFAADVYHPARDGDFPTLMQRTPYGKANLEEWAGVAHFLDAGYRVVIQDVRGSGASGGSQDHRAEIRDSRAAADWVSQQPWFNGVLGTYGASYMGFTQLALAKSRPSYLKAMAIASNGFKPSWFPGGSFALDICLPWTFTKVYGFMEAQQPSLQAKLKDAFMHLPLGTADSFATGQTLEWFQNWVNHPSSEDPFWADVSFTDTIDIDIPVLLIDGWYDYPVGQVTSGYSTRERLGLTTRMSINKGSHFESENSLEETLAFFNTHLKGAPNPHASSVSVYVMPDVGWRDLATWPPPADAITWYLAGDGALAQSVARGAERSQYIYNPADPTPAFGGPSLRMDNCGPVDNRPLEAREDVLTFTTPVLAEACIVIGAISAELHVSSDVRHLDVYLRVCDVAPDGTSTNVCESIERLTPEKIASDEDGVFRYQTQLSPTAYQFKRGHSIRLQVSGGAHPMYARNLGTAEPLATATTLVTATTALHHSHKYPSTITLPTETIR